jgi:predicted AAA+ superfamily ATPase
MKKDNLKQIILDNQEIIWKREYIPREMKLPYADLEILTKIVAIIGPRRAGKTYFLKQITDELKLQKEQIVFLDFSEITFSGFKPAHFELLLQSYYELFPDSTPYFFFDEIQEISGFESGLKFLLNKSFRIFISGSSSKMIVQDLSSILRGKTMNFYLFPLSFQEYLRFKKINISLTDNLTTRDRGEMINALMNFLKWGGFPEVVLSTRDETKTNLLSSYIDIMLFRDIIERYSVKNIHLIDKLFWKLVKSFTKAISINKWYNDFKSQGLKVSKDTLHLYLKYFEDTFFLFFISNSNKGPTGLRKVYLVDNGIYNHVKGFSPDRGKAFENLVFLDLIRKGIPAISFFKTKSGETDFVLENHAFQACYSLSEDNIKRELSGLDEIKKINPEITGNIITVDENEFSYPLKEAVPYWKWHALLHTH